MSALLQTFHGSLETCEVVTPQVSPNHDDGSNKAIQERQTDGVARPADQLCREYDDALLNLARRSVGFTENAMTMLKAITPLSLLSIQDDNRLLAISSENVLDSVRPRSAGAHTESCLTLIKCATRD